MHIYIFRILSSSPCALLKIQTKIHCCPPLLLVLLLSILANAALLLSILANAAFSLRSVSSSFLSLTVDALPLVSLLLPNPKIPPPPMLLCLSPLPPPPSLAPRPINAAVGADTLALPPKPFPVLPPNTWYPALPLDDDDPPGRPFGPTGLSCNNFLGNNQTKQLATSANRLTCGGIGFLRSAHTKALAK